MDKHVSNLEENLAYLKLPFIRHSYEGLAKEAAQKKWSHVEYVARLIKGEADFRHDRTIQRRIRLARFPVIKTLDQFQWTWPKDINRLQVQNLFRMQFV
jgi:DNA replication protein DnaC